MVRKHTVKKAKETSYDEKKGVLTIKETEEHVIVEQKHAFLEGDEDADDADMYFLGSKSKDKVEEEIDEPTLYVYSDDDKFW